MVFTVLPDPMTHGRWLVVRHSPHARLWTPVSSHCEEGSANREAGQLQREHDDKVQRLPPRPHQMVLGFYGPEQGDA
jgi:hypothetical protein